MGRIVAIVLLALGLAAPAWADCSVNLKPFAVTMAGTRPLISGKINGQPVRFVADSGAFFSLLSPAVAQQFKLPLRPIYAPVSVGGIGGSFTPELTTVRSLNIDGLDVPNVIFMVGGAESGDGTAGLLGQNVWHIADVEYDLANGVIRLAQPSGCAGQSLAYWAKSTPVSVLDLWQNPRADMHATIGYATVNGATIKVEFDTGASTSFLSFAAARRARIDPNGKATVPGGVSSGVGRGGVLTRISPVDSFQIGGETIEHTRLRLGDTTLPDADMLLGADFFLSHRIYVANSQGKIYFTYNGGPVFALDTQDSPPAPADPVKTAPAAPLDTANAPASAGDFGRRGAAELGRLEYGAAIADLGRAHLMDPRDPSYLYQRALAYGQDQRADLALTDLNAALALAPDDVEALIARANLQIDAEHADAAVSDLDAAAKLLAPQSDLRFKLAVLYSRAERYGPADAQARLWLQAHPDDPKRAMAFNERCWAGALGGRDLGDALAACDAALRLIPNNANVLAGRGIARLRLGDFDHALSDTRAAAKRDPKNAWALYGLGLAEIRLGKEEQGRADVASAATLDPKLLARAFRLGVAPAVWAPGKGHPKAMKGSTAPGIVALPLSAF